MCFLIWKGLSNDILSGWQGVHRIIGDTAGSWFENRRFRSTKVGGKYRRTTRRRMNNEENVCWYHGKPLSPKKSCFVDIISIEKYVRIPEKNPRVNSDKQTKTERTRHRHGQCSFFHWFYKHLDYILGTFSTVSTVCSGRKSAKRVEQGGTTREGGLGRRKQETREKTQSETATAANSDTDKL